MARGLTDRQREVFDFVCGEIRRQGTPPTVREVADYFGFASPKAASDHLSALERKKYITRISGKARNILVEERLDPRGIPMVRGLQRGTPFLTLENVEGSLKLTKLFGVGKNTFAVRLKDDGVPDAGIGKGDYVVVEAGARVPDGSIGAVQFKDRILVRRLTYEGNSVKWPSEVPGSEDVVVSRNAPGFRIFGPVKGVVKSVC